MMVPKQDYSKCPNCGGRIWMDDESIKKFFTPDEDITARQFLAAATFWCGGCGRMGTYEELKTGEPGIQNVAWEGELVPIEEGASMKELQSLVAKAVAERGYREGWTDEQYAARQMAKAVDELSELVRAIRWSSTHRSWSSLAKDAGEWARDAFDEETWQDVKSVSPEKVALELPDVIIPLLVLADTLGIDLEQAIREKVLGDIERGVRGEKSAKQEQWIPLSELRAGAIFETRDGKRALKTPYVSADNKTAHCVSLKSGRKIYLSVDELVREIAI